MRRGLLTPFAVIVLALMLLPEQGSAERVVEEGKTLEWDAYDSYEIVGRSGDVLRVSLRSTGPVDFLLMSPAGFASYRGAGDASARYAAGSALAADAADRTFRLPGGGAYSLVVDNSPSPRDGAAHGTAVEYTLTVDLEEDSALTAMCALAVVVGAIALITTLAWTSRRARRSSSERVSVGERPTLAVCENCGGSSAGGDRCTICGSRLPTDES